MFLAEGGKVVGELLQSGWPVGEILLCEGADWVQRNRSLMPDGVPVFRLTARQWDMLSQDPSPEGIIAVASRPPETPLKSELALSSGPLLLLYKVNNPNNLGALLRTAGWFGFSLVLLSKDSAEATNPKVVRASMGGLFHVNVFEDVALEDALDEIKGRFLIVGSDARDGIAPHPCGPKTALLLGSESHGLPEALRKRADEMWKIPCPGVGESLSLPQAGAIMMYECVRIARG